VRFLLDENLPTEAGEVLIEHGHDVIHVADTPLRGHSDEDIVREANASDRVLITHDLGISEPQNRPRTGLVLIRVPPRLVRRLTPVLVKSYVATLAESELRGRVTSISPGQVRSRPME
jgi:predicted nuclease of predicted toxin-antitoxin system